MQNKNQNVEARELLEEAQESMRDAIQSLSKYVKITGDHNTGRYILDHLRTLTDNNHSFLGRDRSIEDVLADLEDLETEVEEAEDLEIQAGDHVRITCALFGTVDGIVIRANNSILPNQPDDWYIEINSQQAGYIYWKQQIDGGTVEKL